MMVPDVAEAMVLPLIREHGAHRLDIRTHPVICVECGTRCALRNEVWICVHNLPTDVG